jgi:cytochrome P450
MTFETLTQHWQIPAPARPVYRASDGVWHVTAYAPARELLAGAVSQAGFSAEVMERLPKRWNKPVLFQEGDAHHEQRRQTARFFTPATVQQRYIPLMERTADAILAGFRSAGQADLNRLAAEMATGVIAEVVGLTESKPAELARRLEAILGADLDMGLDLARLPRYLKLNWMMAQFARRDVRPAVRARRAQPREDVISHLLAQGRGEAEIVIECITYGAAGMVTTQEFICIAAWHLLRDTELKRRYLVSDVEGRRLLLGELLRLEPVVGHLFRRAQEALAVETAGEKMTIPAGALIDFHLYEINRDSNAVGAKPLEFDPARERGKGVHPAAMSFGSGAHRCAGEHLAMIESEIFLSRLLAIETLSVRKPPRLGLNRTTTSYQVREFLLGC